jgi:hypothetical protein
MYTDKYKKNCTQVKTPEVDNSSPCDDFIYSECVILNRKSELLKNIQDKSLNDYMEKLEGEIRLLKLENTNIKKIIKNLITIIPEVGIGVFED